eukprot:CAMPEP_0201572744 /NCGR_PEP_ID=MMETSP0190_2-20130828/16191_1 /ASSEMBLY_ACC=CAM_ASM_000263 /TAXON_ID=37353 /ORGANISM="Rosalina sp." /LENGTH=65 /DNA_ID=CAMNT_0047998883 /DNA_START=1 /DNA_END=198 /DNA_ORIENTATION=-
MDQFQNDDTNNNFQMHSINAQNDFPFAQIPSTQNLNNLGGTNQHQNGHNHYIQNNGDQVGFPQIP